MDSGMPYRFAAPLLRAAGVPDDVIGLPERDRIPDSFVSHMAIADIERLQALVQIGDVVCEECGASATRVVNTWAYCQNCLPIESKETSE